ncbi:MAG: 1-acyl-sn-glycerol-3-phosphate acyltransferase [Spirochaetae bacterium HGW-Spirochaetae-9]|jgi:1-acyl-sn-glycerol-3-phosphate acyltransferase|nr:MAG: 1-acyl-sn-glycerol-3-phosphate acyltransferase [Spirochaetae bacterium HGW-Spirochaetae-9]PKM14901.1 MAG: 1-acyl-sn-glycerol-3-phosphate acyltransferase [Gammaproteobacteria bacterium HGW-Gammaproteobacteria-2]
MKLPRRTRLALRVQRGISYLCFALFGPILTLIYRFRFRFSAHHVDQIRAQYRALREQHPGPLLICSNHLTLVDSIIQTIVLGSLWDYLRHPASLPWNLPEAKNFYHRFSWRLVCYLGRCIPVERGASAEQARFAQARMRYVLDRGDAIAIFPEGRRSRDGRVDDKDYSYGVGQLLNRVPGAKVLCVYLRGMRFGGFADFPTPGDRFYVQLKMLVPQSASTGLRRARDFSAQIIGQLKAMEDEYFAARESGALSLPSAS